MRALWIVRSNLERHTGGDTVQVLETARALRSSGVEVELTSALEPELGGYDLLHLFHLDRLWENLPHARRARAQGLPVVLSTIWWPAQEFDAHGRRGLQGALARALGAELYPTLRLAQRSLADFLATRGAGGRRPRLSFERAVRELLAATSLLLPNSAAEAEALRAAFGDATPYEVVPNAADSSFFHLPPEPAPPREPKVLCIGRIEPRKGQLALVEAMTRLDLPLELAGRAGRFSQGYERACRRAAGPTVRFLGQLDRGVLRERLWRAAVHAAPSWYETPGLASLEAALCGARLVLTPGGSTREYFGDEALYCEAGDPASIAAAVEAALASPAPPALAARLARECSWERAAEATARAYRRALEGG